MFTLGARVRFSLNNYVNTPFHQTLTLYSRTIGTRLYLEHQVFTGTQALVLGYKVCKKPKPNRVLKPRFLYAGFKYTYIKIIVTHK